MAEAIKSWQARIGEATDAIARSFVESMSYDWRLYRQDVAGSIAHARMLAKAGLISDPDFDAIERGLRDIEAEINRDGAAWAGFRPELEDIHMCVEAALIERIGEPGRRLHTGRSRNDQVAVDLSMWVAQAHGELIDKVRLTQKALLALAERSVEIVMPSFTHLQRAQPISAAAECLAWMAMLEGDAARCGAMRTAALATCPLGSGAIAGSSLPLDPAMTAAELGFGGGPVSGIERTASRDAACDLVYACAMIAQHLSRLAEQWILYMSTEFGFLKIADRHTTSSSMMPQKRNPDMLELIRGRCGNVYGDLVGLMTILKGLPIGYNRDLQEDKRLVFRAFDTTVQCLTMAAAIVAGAGFDADRIAPTLDRGFLDATSLAEYLVTLGVPFRTAHHVVGTLVARCEKEGKHALSQLPVAAFNEVLAGKSGVRVDDGVYGCLGAANVVGRYKTAGAGGGKGLEERMGEWRGRLGS